MLTWGKFIVMHCERSVKVNLNFFFIDLIRNLQNALLFLVYIYPTSHKFLWQHADFFVVVPGNLSFVLHSRRQKWKEEF